MSEENEVETAVKFIQRQINYSYWLPDITIAFEDSIFMVAWLRP